MKGPDLRSALHLTAVLVVVCVAFSSSPLRAAGGPTTTEPAAQGGGSICYHVFSSDYVCPDSSRMQFYSYDAIESATLTMVTRGGQRRQVNLTGGVDAVFLTREATEKFLLSYYWALNRDKATRLQRILGNAASR